VPRFIEDNWLKGARLGGGSFDAAAGSLMDLFDFKAGGKTAAVYVDPEQGTPLSAPPAGH
jgi:phospholipase C